MDSSNLLTITSKTAAMISEAIEMILCPDPPTGEELEE